MKVEAITDGRIVFSDGSFIFYQHEQDCCECNYADFEELRETYTDIFDKEFDRVDIEAKDEGFLLILEKENKTGQIDESYTDGVAWILKDYGHFYKYWVPCRSVQNGYYSTDLKVVYVDKYGYEVKTIYIGAELIYY